MAMSRFTRLRKPVLGLGSCREYSHSKSPVTAFRACTWSPDECTKMTPSCTSGVASLAPGNRDQLQVERSWATLDLLICFKGLKPWSSYVRRQVSHSLAGGFCNRV